MKKQGMISLLAIIIALNSLVCILTPESPAPGASLPTASKTLLPTNPSTKVDSMATPTPQIAQNRQGLLSGEIMGLDADETVTLHLGFLKGGNLADFRPGPFGVFEDRGTFPAEKGETVKRFTVKNGHWQVEDLSLRPGLYHLSLESETYISTRRSITFVVPQVGIAWRRTYLNFDLVAYEQVMERLGVPLCTEPFSGGYITPTVIGTHTPTPTPILTPVAFEQPVATPTWPAGTCFARHQGTFRVALAGIVGEISGLPDDEVATVKVYRLPPKEGETYSTFPPPMSDSEYYLPPRFTPLTNVPPVEAAWPLTATVTAKNGLWGIVDPTLARKKYLVLAQAEGYTAQPSGYEVVVFAGRTPDIQGQIDFVFK